jgi:hypothetical protein
MRFDEETPMSVVKVETCRRMPSVPVLWKGGGSQHGIPGRRRVQRRPVLALDDADALRVYAEARVDRLLRELLDERGQLRAQPGRLQENPVRAAFGAEAEQAGDRLRLEPSERAMAEADRDRRRDGRARLLGRRLRRRRRDGRGERLQRHADGRQVFQRGVAHERDHRGFVYSRARLPGLDDRLEAVHRDPRGDRPPRSRLQLFAECARSARVHPQHGLDVLAGSEGHGQRCDLLEERLARGVEGKLLRRGRVDGEEIAGRHGEDASAEEDVDRLTEALPEPGRDPPARVRMREPADVDAGDPDSGQHRVAQHVAPHERENRDGGYEAREQERNEAEPPQSANGANESGGDFRHGVFGD